MQYLEQWCLNPNNDLRANWVKQLNKTLREPNKQTFAVGSRQMWYWANWHAQHGLLSILNGDPRGWEQLELSFRYRWWKMRIDPVMTLVSEPALLLAHALAFGDHEKISWLAEYQIDSFNGKFADLWQFSRFGLFGLKLWAMIADTSDKVEALSGLPNMPPLGVYGSILQHWNDDQQLSAAICEACDYNLQQALAQDGYPDFDRSPYDLLPIDYLALRQVRTTLGLTTPLPQHPLLRPDLVNPPDTWNQPIREPDPEIAKLVEKAGLSTQG